MHLLKIDKENYIGQADPYILESGGRYYIYTTGDYATQQFDKLCDMIKDEGMKVMRVDEFTDMWNARK